MLIPKSIFELFVLSYGGNPPATPLRCRLDSATQLIVGRSPGCQMVLDDPERLISRSQARISIAGADAVRVENISSSSPILIGAQVLSPGQSMLMRTSQQLLLGRYVLGMAVLETTPSTAVAPERPIIPDDFDVFAVAARPATSTAEDSNALSLTDMVAEKETSIIDELPLSGVVSVESTLSRSLPVPVEMPGVADVSADDPLALLSRHDPGRDIDEAPSSAPLDHGMAETELFHLPEVHHETIPPALVESTMPSPKLAVELSPSFPPAPNLVKEEIAPAVQKKVVADSKDIGLMAAFARGCRVPESALPKLTPEFMEELGRIFLAMTSGTVRLVQARSAAKHEMRAGVTIIATEGNNPLKFSPDGTSAVIQLLGNRFQGFMDPLRAIEDAVDDLAAHQVGLLAGARTALYELAGRFSPESFERRYGEPAGLASKFPTIRRSELWMSYVNTYASLVGTASEELESLLEDAFSRAYEQEIERIYEGRAE